MEIFIEFMILYFSVINIYKGMKHENLRNIYNCEIKDNCEVLK